MAVRRVDHVGINVTDLEAAKAFFVAVGLEPQGEMELDGDWLGDIIGLTDVRTRLVGMQAPGAGAWIELTTFIHPTDGPDAGALPANAIGIQHVCLAVDDLDETLDRIRAAGYDTIGSVVNWQQAHRLCYVRGPEGIIVELAEAQG